MNTKTLKFVGYSDDTFGEETTGQDYDNCANDKSISCVVASADGSVVVVGDYHRHPFGGCWVIGLSMIDEDAPIPPWPVRVTASPDVPYSPMLEIDVPDDVTLTWYSGREKVTAE